MKRLLSIFLAVVMILSLVACGGKTEEETKPVDSKPTESTTEEKKEETKTEAPKEKVKVDGGTFAMPLSADVTELISIVTSDDNIWQALSPMWDMMWYETGDGTNFYLAESYEISDDALDYTIKLVENAKWHDGEAITADDLIFTLDACRTIDNANNIVTPNNAEITYEKLDDYTVKIHLSKPVSFYSNVLGRLTILPEHIYEGDVNVKGHAKSNAGIGSGPYKLEAWNKGESLVYSRNEDYYRGKPNLETIVMKVMPDAAVQEMALQNGEISMMRITTQEQLDKFNNKEEFNVYSFSEVRTNFLLLRTSDNIFQDIKARQAFCLALNIPEIVEASFGSEIFASPAGSMFTPMTKYYNPEQKNFEQDLELAKKLAEESGLAGTTLKYGYRTDRVGMEAQALMVQQQLKEIGVEVELITGKFGSGAVANDEQEVKLDLISNGADSLIGDPGTKNGTFGNSKKHLKNTGRTQEYLDAWNAAISGVTEEERAAAYKDVQALVYDSYSFIPTSQPNYVFVASSDFGGLDINQTVMLFQDYIDLYMVG